MKLYTGFDVWLPTAPDHERDNVVAHPELQDNFDLWGGKLREWGYTWPGDRTHIQAVETV